MEELTFGVVYRVQLFDSICWYAHFSKLRRLHLDSWWIWRNKLLGVVYPLDNGQYLLGIMYAPTPITIALSVTLSVVIISYHWTLEVNILRTIKTGDSFLKIWLPQSPHLIFHTFALGFDFKYEWVRQLKQFKKKLETSYDILVHSIWINLSRSNWFCTHLSPLPPGFKLNLFTIPWVWNFSNKKIQFFHTKFIF